MQSHIYIWYIAKTSNIENIQHLVLLNTIQSNTIFLVRNPMLRTFSLKSYLAIEFTFLFSKLHTATQKDKRRNCIMFLSFVTY